MLTSVRVCVFFVRMQCVVRVFCAEMKCTQNKEKEGINEDTTKTEVQVRALVCT